MALKLYMHPLSSFCHKVLIALYENDIEFEVMRIDDPAVGESFRRMWPIGRFPVLRDDARDHLVPESSIIIEYLALHYPGRVALLPDDPDLARQVRMRDRFFDNYLHAPMQKIPADRLRPAAERDPHGVAAARALYRTALDLFESEIAAKRWVMGEQFTMADCAAGPPLYFGNLLIGSFRESHPGATSYLERLMARPSYARVLEEAKPYLHLVPG